ncbi:cathepsin K-like [Heterodontus francisci]|uniref:cathepsin K-like n=1 Tax=Heterodontus francisci TaxID=7792 RepID=UPI00355BEEC5
MELSLFVMCILTVTSTASANPIIDEEWEIWKQAYGKSYPSVQEDMARRAIWLENMEKIAAHNAQYRQGISTYEMAMNQFGDLTPVEFVQFYTDVKMYEMTNYTDNTLSDVELEELEEVEEVGNLPKEVDWRRMGYVRQVKNQGWCLSCYAFAAAGALEGQLAKKWKQYVDLSVQNIIDCSDEYNNYGCNGGLPYRAFEYIRDNGIESDQSYPYQAKKNSKCLFSSSKSITKINTFKRFKHNTEKQLTQMVASVGPISVLVHSSLDSWIFYKSGIFDNVKCNIDNIDHAVVLVGYVDEHPEGYWIIKNSWGTSWGENGYMRMVKGKNMCGINYCASYPII